jgi:hypothetical protein
MGWKGCPTLPVTCGGVRARESEKNWVKTPAPRLRADSPWMKATCPRKTHHTVRGLNFGGPLGN